MIEAVLLDMDGVLVDSEPFIKAAAIAMFAELGYRVTPADFTPYVGAGENRFIGGVAEHYGVPLDIDTAKARTYNIYEKIITGNLAALPGVSSILERCTARALAVALATSADTRKMRANLAVIGLRPESFNACVDGLDVEHRKPHPEIYLTAAGRLGVEPGHCLVVEDAPNGIVAAHRAGCRCAALTTSFSGSVLSEADWITENLATLPDEALDW